MRKRPKMKISKTKLHQIIKEELRNALREGRKDGLRPDQGSTKYGGRTALPPKKLPTTARQSPAQKEQNELEDLARMAAAAQEETASNEAYLKLANEKSVRTEPVTNDNPLKPHELRQMIEPMSLADRLRLTNTINLSFGRSTIGGPGSGDAAIAQAKAMFADPDSGPGSDPEVAAAQPHKTAAAAHAAYDRYMKANK
jgi:hypothetical protein